MHPRKRADEDPPEESDPHQSTLVRQNRPREILDEVRSVANRGAKRKLRPSRAHRQSQIVIISEVV